MSAGGVGRGALDMEGSAAQWRNLALLAAGPAVGVAAMLRLRRLPEAPRPAGGRRWGPRRGAGERTGGARVRWA